jgi:hypothetical protein
VLCPGGFRVPAASLAVDCGDFYSAGALVAVSKTMDIMLVVATSRNFEDWLRLRLALYTGMDLAFHNQEMTQFLQDEAKQCYLAVSKTGEVLVSITWMHRTRHRRRTP